MNIQDTLRAAILRANETGSAVAVIEGWHVLSEAIWVSSHRSKRGALRLDGCLTIDARAATIKLDGPNAGFRFEGSAARPQRHARILWDGGRILGDGSEAGQVAFKGYDLMSSTIHPHSVEQCGVGIRAGVFRSWSENCGYGGLPGRECYFRNCRRGIELYGRQQFWDLLGTKPEDPETRRLKYESFAGTTIGDIIVAGATNPELDGQAVYADHAAVYRSSIATIRGNTPNGGGSLIYSNNQYWRATTIKGIAVEKANEKDKPRSAAIRFAKPLTARPDIIERPWWMGGMASGVEYASMVDRLPLPQANRDHEFASGGE